jgi:hypothetical protein
VRGLCLTWAHIIGRETNLCGSVKKILKRNKFKIHVYIIDYKIVRCTYIFTSSKKKRKRKKEKKKGTPLWYVNVGGHPMESVSHGL